MLLAPTDGMMYLATAGLLYVLWRLWDDDVPPIERPPPSPLEAPGPPRSRMREALRDRRSACSQSPVVLSPQSAKPPSMPRDSSLASQTDSSFPRMTDRSPPPSPDALTAETESTFTIEGPDGTNTEAVLHTVDAPADRWEGAGRTNLYFDVDAPMELSEGIYRIEHPRLSAFRARIEPVEAGGRRPDQTGYRAVVVE